MSAVMRGLIDQPTISRLKRSGTTARYNQPSSVQTQVRSAVQTRFGAAGLKWRLSRLSATGNACFESVVAPLVDHSRAAVGALELDAKSCASVRYLRSAVPPRFQAW